MFWHLKQKKKTSEENRNVKHSLFRNMLLLRGNALALANERYLAVIWNFRAIQRYVWRFTTDHGSLSISISVLNNKQKFVSFASYFFFFSDTLPMTVFCVLIKSSCWNDFPFVKQMKASPLYLFILLTEIRSFYFDRNHNVNSKNNIKKNERRNLQHMAHSRTFIKSLA